MKRKILLFNQSREIGGTDTFLINLVKFWPNKLDELIFWCNRDHKGAGLYRELGIKCDIATFPTMQVLYERAAQPKYPPLIRKAMRIALYLLTPLLFIMAVISLFNKIKKEGVSVVFSSNGGYPGGK